jgi:hypothetical protein
LVYILPEQLPVAIVIIHLQQVNGLPRIRVADAQDTGQQDGPFPIAVIDMGIDRHINQLSFV